MNDTSTQARDPTRELQLRAARAIIARELGPERLARLHETNMAIDLAAIGGLIALFLACAWQLATGSAADWLWWVCLFLQGDVIVVMAILNHDAFVHRKLLPTPLRWVVSSVLAWPAQLRSALYESQHLTHHRMLGTDGDTEMHKHGIDTAFKRIVYATPALIVFRAIFYRGLIVNRKAKPAHGGESRLRWEKGTRYTIVALALASLAWDWRLLVIGYLLPFVTVSPMVNTLRIVLEHFDLGRGNPLWVGTNYRTGIVTRVMFWWGAGDCHMVHHFYANIPFYRMGQALKLMRPILIRHGVYEHRSLMQLMAQWFSGSRAHWSVPPAAANEEAVPKTA
jgi:fatty acid desaturase